MEKLNVAELLKDCPQGMELCCTIWDSEAKVFLETVLDDDFSYPIEVTVKYNNIEYTKSFTKYGAFNDLPYCKCVIFPKGKTTWEGFVPPCKFKDGDIIADEHGNIAIYKGTMWYNKKLAGYYCGYRKFDNCFIPEPKKDGHFGSIEEIRFATEEEKQKLFDIIKANDYRWNLETKTLEKIPKLNDGDIVVTEIGSIFIYNKSLDNQDYFGCYVGLSCIKSKTPKIIIMDQFSFKNSNLRLATEEEKAKLFQAIKDNGYHWNAETKTLEKLSEPKFKVGNKIRLKSKRNHVYTIHSLTWDNNKLAYRLLPDNDKHLRVVSLTTQDDYELVSDKFDITTLKPFESKVLVRNDKNDKWQPTFWGFYDEDSYYYPYKTTGGKVRYCIPYKGNEWLRGKKDDCDDFYKTWEQ